MAVGVVRRGDIYLTHFGPARAGEPDFKRPAVIITNNVANAKADALSHSFAHRFPKQSI